MNDRIKFLKDRREGIGGSDIAAIVNYYSGIGLNTTKTALDIYNSKVGTEDITDDQTDYQYFGTQIEDIIAKLYERSTKTKVISPNKIIAHEKYPYLRGNIDRWILQQTGLPKILECKSANWRVFMNRWSSEGKEEIPDEYKVQVAFYSAIKNLSIDVALYAGELPIKIYSYEKDETLEKEIVDMAVTFWNEHVIKKIPPEITSKSDFKKYVDIPDGKKILPITDDLTKLTEKYKKLTQDKKIIEKEQDEIKLNLTKALLSANCNKAVMPGGKTAFTISSYIKKQFNQKNFKEENIELYEKYCVDSEIKTVRVY